MHSLKELIQNTKQLRVLYVEDDNELRNSTYEMLHNFFESIELARDGQEGLDKFLEDSFDLIISDIRMPRLSGLEMIEQIREHNKEIAILIFSAHDESHYFTQSIESGIDGYLIKPIDLNQFTQTLFKTIEKLRLQKENLAFQSQLKHMNQELEQKVQERTEALERQLYVDSLTKLQNRQALSQKLKTLTQEQTPILILIDIDNFKHYNEFYGVELGNAILIEFSKLIEHFAKQRGYALYRIAGDEFILFDITDFVDLQRYEEDLEDLLTLIAEEPLYIKELNESLSIDVSIGLNFEKEKAISKAQIALDTAKRLKKPYVAFNYNIDRTRQIKEVFYWRDEIKAALKEERIVPFFQPIVNEKAQIVKYEVLMRMLQVNNGQTIAIAPFKFLDIAMKTKLYLPLSQMVINKAFDIMQERACNFSINLTYYDIKNHEIKELLKRRIQAYQKIQEKLFGKYYRVIFEIVESENIEDYEYLKSFLDRFKRYGVEVAVDDFGSGYSNFSHILGIKPNYLKIDGSLIKNITTNKDSFTLVKAISSFAKELDMKTIAEFVSSEEIFEKIKPLGINEFQGYHFGQPEALS